MCPGADRWSVDLRDAEVSRVARAGLDLHLGFAVVAVRGGARGVYLKAVGLRLADVRVVRLDGGCVGRLSDGRLLIDGLQPADVIVPSLCSGRIDLQLTFANGAQLDVAGSAVQLFIDGAPEVVEHLHC